MLSFKSFSVFDLIVLLVLALLFFNGILFQSVELIFFLLVFVGSWISITKKQAFEPNQKVFFYLTYLYVLFIVINIAFITSDLNKVFEWEFTAYELLLFLPLVAVSLNAAFKDEQLFWKVLIVSSSFSFIWIGLLIESGSYVRFSGWLTNAINRGNIAMLFGIFSLVAFFAVRDRKWKVAALVFFFSGVGLSVLSGSRGGWFALILSFLTLGFIFFRYQMRLQLKWMLIASITGFLLVTLFWDKLPIESRVMETIMNVGRYLNGDVHSSIGHRFEMWKGALHAIQQKLLWGWGWTDYRVSLQNAVNAGVVSQGLNYPQPHNQFLLVSVELGLLGLLFFLLFLSWPIYVAVKYLKGSSHFPSYGYLAILLIVMTEVLVEFMLSDRTFSHKYFIVTYSLIVIIAFRFISIDQKGIVKPAVETIKE